MQDNTSNKPYISRQEDNLANDLAMLLRVLWEYLPILLLMTAIGAMLGYLYSSFFQTPRYSSVTKIYVLANTLDEENSQRVTQSDFSAGTALTSDFVEIIRSRTVSENVVSRLSLNTSYETIRSSISVSTQQNSRVITISYRNVDPYRAYDICEMIREVACEEIQSIIPSASVQTIDEASLPTYKSSPNKKRMALTGAMIGWMISLLGVLLAQMASDTIVSSEDVARYLELSNLGSIPFEESLDPNAGKLRKRKKS